MKCILSLYLLFGSIISFSQKDEFHTFLETNNNDYPYNIKPMGDSTAIIFTSKGYYLNNGTSYGSFLSKVDYCGEILLTSDVSLDDYYNVMLVDGLLFNNAYTFIGTAVKISSNQPCIISVKSSLDLEIMEIIDFKPINFSVISSESLYSSKDEANQENNLLLSLSTNTSSDLEVLMITYHDDGSLLKSDIIPLEEKFISDYYYNQNQKKHFIYSGAFLTILNQDKELIRSYRIYLEIGGAKYFGLDHRILYADDKKVVFAGRWQSRRTLHTYVIYLDENGWKPGPYNPNAFPNKIWYHLRKKIGENHKIILSSSTNLLDEVESIPNDTYFWEMNTNGQIEKTYIFSGKYQKYLGIENIDANGNLFGLGFEYITKRNFFIIINEKSIFLSGTSITTLEKDEIDIYPNPTENDLNINAEEAITSIQIFDMLGRLHSCFTEIFDSSVTLNVGNLPPGQYFILLKMGNKIEQKKFFKI